VALPRLRDPRGLSLMTRSVDPQTIESLTEAVREVERCSCAEIVVEIRSRSGSYGHADARFASLLAFVALLVLLFSPWPFAAGWVALDVALVWTVGLFSARKSEAVRRLMTTERERVTQVRTIAASTFHERGVANTKEETGVLVYLSMLEGRIELLADRGVLQAVPSLEWNQLAESARRQHATTETLLALVRGLTPLLEKHLPVREGDEDELCNVPRFVGDDE
jgi:putative membrane protein